MMTPNPTLKVGDRITLALFDDAVLDAEISNVTRYPNGAVGLTAHLQNGREGTVFLSYCDGQMRASVQAVGGTDFCVRYDPATGAHYAVEVDRKNSIVLEGAEPQIPPADDAAADASAQPVSSEPVALADAPAGSTAVSVMVVYTPAALAYEGNVANMNANIAQAMQKANEAHTNSDTQVYLNLVHSAEVTYTEITNDFGASDLDNLTYTGRRYSAMDEVQSWRNQYGADLVCLFESTSEFGGLGWLLTDTNGSPDFAFCLARVQQSDWTYTVVHEWGHNMGCHHHKLQNVQPGPTVWENWSTNTWSAGWRWIGTNGANYCSVMTYESGTYFADGQTSTRKPYFSNPAITYNGVSTGDAADGDNARTIRAMKTVLAAYRADIICTVTFDAQGGSAANPASIIVTNGSTYGTLATTTRTGYTLGGWWTGTNGTGSQVLSTTTVSIASNQTLYAKWTVNSYTVTFDAQGGSAASPASKSVTYDSTYGTLATTARTGYTLGGWWTGTNGTGSQVTSTTTVSIVSNQTLYAKWTANSYTVTFDAQGGSAADPASTNVTYDSTYGTLATTTLAGYTFSGWWTGTNGTGTEVTFSTTVSITTAQTLYAMWAVSYTSQGTPCPWLDQYGLVTGTNYETAAAEDVDGDGLTAWQEYIAGTDPTNGASCLKAAQAIRNIITWSAVSGRVYGVNWTTNLLNSFQPLETNIVWPQAGYTDTVHGTEIQNFYRINVRLAE